MKDTKMKAARSNPNVMLRTLSIRYKHSDPAVMLRTLSIRYKHSDPVLTCVRMTKRQGDCGECRQGDDGTKKAGGIIHQRKYPVRDSNAELILRRDAFYPVKLTRHATDGLAAHQVRDKYN